jgi:HEAT repeat protein
MGPVQAARLFALKGAWHALGSRAAGRALVRALASPDEGVRTVAGMFLAQAGKKAEPLVEEAIRKRVNLPMTLVIAGDIGAARLKPEMERLTSDPDPNIAKAARDGLRIMTAQNPAPKAKPPAVAEET